MDSFCQWSFCAFHLVKMPVGQLIPMKSLSIKNLPTCYCLGRSDGKASFISNLKTNIFVHVFIWIYVYFSSNAFNLIWLIFRTIMSNVAVHHTRQILWIRCLLSTRLVWPCVRRRIENNHNEYLFLTSMIMKFMR